MFSQEKPKDSKNKSSKGPIVVSTDYSSKLLKLIEEYQQNPYDQAQLQKAKEETIIEIERKFRSSQMNQTYKFQRKEQPQISFDNGEKVSFYIQKRGDKYDRKDSQDSIKNCSIYNLHSQNEMKRKRVLILKQYENNQEEEKKQQQQLNEDAKYPNKNNQTVMREEKKKDHQSFIKSSGDNTSYLYGEEKIFPKTTTAASQGQVLLPFRGTRKNFTKQGGLQTNDNEKSEQCDTQKSSGGINKPMKKLTMIMCQQAVNQVKRDPPKQFGSISQFQATEENQSESRHSIHSQRSGIGAQGSNQFHSQIRESLLQDTKDKIHKIRPLKTEADNEKEKGSKQYYNAPIENGPSKFRRTKILSLDSEGKKINKSKEQESDKIINQLSNSSSNDNSLKKSTTFQIQVIENKKNLNNSFNLKLNNLQELDHLEALSNYSFLPTSCAKVNQLSKMSCNQPQQRVVAGNILKSVHQENNFISSNSNSYSEGGIDSNLNASSNNINNCSNFNDKYKGNHSLHKIRGILQEQASSSAKNKNLSTDLNDKSDQYKKQNIDQSQNGKKNIKAALNRIVSNGEKSQKKILNRQLSLGNDKNSETKSQNQIIDQPIKNYGQKVDQNRFQSSGKCRSEENKLTFIPSIGSIVKNNSKDSKEQTDQAPFGAPLVGSEGLDIMRLLKSQGKKGNQQQLQISTCNDNLEIERKKIIQKSEQLSEILKNHTKKNSFAHNPYKKQINQVNSTQIEQPIFLQTPQATRIQGGRNILKLPNQEPSRKSTVNQIIEPNKKSLRIKTPLSNKEDYNPLFWAQVTASTTIQGGNKEPMQKDIFPGNQANYRGCNLINYNNHDMYQSHNSTNVDNNQSYSSTGKSPHRFVSTHSNIFTHGTSKNKDP